MKRFNVHWWNGSVWEYMATVSADSGQLAVQLVAKKFGLIGRFASYPNETPTSDTVFMMVG